MNYLDFIRNNKIKSQNTNILTEAFRTSEIDKVHDLMLDIFRKKISSKVCKWEWLDTRISGKDMRSFFFIDLEGTPKVWALNYLLSSESSEVYSISLFDEQTSGDFLWGDETNYKASLEISTLGTSVAYFIPIICHVVNNNAFDLTKTEASELAEEVFNKGYKNESRIFKYGALNYTILENLTEQDKEDMFFLSNGYVMESTPAQEYRWRKKQERDDAYSKMRKTGSREDREIFNNLADEYKEILNAIRGGATTVEDVQMALSRNKVVKITSSEPIADKQLKEPKQAFKEMSVYIKTVMRGLQPGLIICGAPGVGKTYKVLQQLRANGYEDGYNLDIIKGKCTPRQLYLSLFQYRERGKIIVIDDADALVGPHAPEDCINMLKAALDSTASEEGRKVSYRIAGNILDDEGREVPKTCYYNGGIIVITNYNMGQLDTALRGRTFVQSLDFTNEQILDLIEDMMPNLGQGQLSESSKAKALDYLKELAESGADMEISIRTFMTCARLFVVCEGELDMSDTDVKSMIKEQMENQAIRGGRKY